VLVVDDSRLAREAGARLLAAAGYQSVAAEDGWEAWEIVGERRFDAVVTALQMPRLDGFQRIARIRREATLRGLPIIVLSSRTSQAARDRVLAAGANVFLPKSRHRRSLNRGNIFAKNEEPTEEESMHARKEVDCFDLRKTREVPGTNLRPHAENGDPQPIAHPTMNSRSGWATRADHPTPYPRPGHGIRLHQFPRKAVPEGGRACHPARGQSTECPASKNTAWQV
jgi:CheY-like chemotaxis protein